tara:strand:+ start:23352 stop:23606 length:255 start_codon:yes stop_codon:yes gene_type:complete
MSRINTIGINPKNGEPVEVCYGYDEVPGFTPGYFFQVFSGNEEDISNDPSGEGMIINEGFLEGISKKKLRSIAAKYSVTLNPNY